jgi:hypothetical protein
MAAPPPPVDRHAAYLQLSKYRPPRGWLQQALLLQPPGYRHSNGQGRLLRFCRLGRRPSCKVAARSVGRGGRQQDDGGVREGSGVPLVSWQLRAGCLAASAPFGGRLAGREGASAGAGAALCDGLYGP